MAATLEALDGAIEGAGAAGVSAKYAKKTRRRLQQQLDVATGRVPSEPRPGAAAAGAAGGASAASAEEGPNCASAPPPPSSPPPPPRAAATAAVQPEGLVFAPVPSTPSLPRPSQRPVLLRAARQGSAPGVGHNPTLTPEPAARRLHLGAQQRPPRGPTAQNPKQAAAAAPAVFARAARQAGDAPSPPPPKLPQSEPQASVGPVAWAPLTAQPLPPLSRASPAAWGGPQRSGNPATGPSALAENPSGHQQPVRAGEAVPGGGDGSGRGAQDRAPAAAQAAPCAQPAGEARNPSPDPLATPLPSAIGPPAARGWQVWAPEAQAPAPLSLPTGVWASGINPDQNPRHERGVPHAGAWASRILGPSQQGPQGGSAPWSSSASAAGPAPGACDPCTVPCNEPCSGPYFGLRAPSQANVGSSLAWAAPTNPNPVLGHPGPQVSAASPLQPSLPEVGAFAVGVGGSLFACQQSAGVHRPPILSYATRETDWGGFGQALRAVRHAGSLGGTTVDSADCGSTPRSPYPRAAQRDPRGPWEARGAGADDAERWDAGSELGAELGLSLGFEPHNSFGSGSSAAARRRPAEGIGGSLFTNPVPSAGPLALPGHVPAPFPLMIGSSLRHGGGGCGDGLGPFVGLENDGSGSGQGAPGLLGALSQGPSEGVCGVAAGEAGVPAERLRSLQLGQDHFGAVASPGSLASASWGPFGR